MTMSGNAILTKTGGGSFIISDHADGTLTMKDNAQLLVGGEFWVGQGTGNQATGTLNMEGGTISVDAWAAVGRDESKGTFNMTGGVFNKNGTGSVSGADLVDTAIVINGNAERVAVINHSGGTMNNLASPTAIAERPVNVSEWNASGDAVGNFNTFRVGFGGQATVNISGQRELHRDERLCRLELTSNNNVLNLNGGTFRRRVHRGRRGQRRWSISMAEFSKLSMMLWISSGATSSQKDLTVQGGGLKFDSNGKTVGISNSAPRQSAA